MEKKISIARLYFNYGQSAKGLPLLKSLWDNSLSDLLLKKAKESNIEQANLFIATAGYLNFQDIQNNISETHASKNPVCLELVDTDEKIRSFLEQNKDNLQKVKVIIINPNNEVIKC